MAEWVDAPDLGSGAFGREGSTPSRAIYNARVVELADTPDSRPGALCVWVRIPPWAKENEE